MNSDWTDIMGQVHANHRLTADLLGPDVNEDNFAERIVALIAKRRRNFVAQRFQDKRNKPMTYAQLMALYENFVKNQSSTIIHNKLQSQNIRRSLKMTDEDFGTSWLKKSNNQLKLQRRKSLGARKKSSTELDLTADDRSFIRVLSDDSDDSNDDDDPPNFWPAFAAWEVIPTGLGDVNALYFMDKSSKYFTHLREILHLVDRKDLFKLYGMVVPYYEEHPLAGSGMILWGDLQVLFWNLMKVGTVLVFWADQQQWVIRSWRLFPFSGVHVLETISGKILYMFADTPYPLSAQLMKKMLKHKLEVEIDGIGNDMTYAEQLIQFIKNQVAASFSFRILAVNGFASEKSWFWYTLLGLDHLVFKTADEQLAIRLESLRVEIGSQSLGLSFLGANGLTSPRVNGYLVKAHQTHSCSCGGLVEVQDSMLSFMLLIQSFSRYVVPTGRVKVPDGRYVVPTGKDNVIVSTGRTKVIPAGIMEYLVKDSKRHAFWSLNEDISKITVLKTNTPYLSKKIRPHQYATSITKNYAARYHIHGIEDMIPDRWSKETHRYIFEALNEDMYLLQVQDKLHHLPLEFVKDFNNALLLFIKRVVIQNSVKDIQLGVESYQQTLNLTKPMMFFEGIDQRIPFTMSGTYKGVVYLNQHNIKSFMKLSEVKKLCDGTLEKIRENLVDMVKRNKLSTVIAGLGVKATTRLITLGCSGRSSVRSNRTLLFRRRSLRFKVLSGSDNGSTSSELEARALSVLAAGFENRPPMLEKGNYDTWQSRMLMYIKRKENGQMLLDFVLSGPFQFKVITIPANTEINRAIEKRMQTLADLTGDEKKRKECDIMAANIILQGLPDDIYTLLNQMKTVNTIWYRVNELIEGT
ncbi:hypothetical protein Tco_1334802 [Tanacetum coccineum]